MHVKQHSQGTQSAFISVRMGSAIRSGARSRMGLLKHRRLRHPSSATIAHLDLRSAWYLLQDGVEHRSNPPCSLDDGGVAWSEPWLHPYGSTDMHASSRWMPCHGIGACHHVQMHAAGPNSFHMQSVAVLIDIELLDDAPNQPHLPRWSTGSKMMCEYIRAAAPEGLFGVRWNT